MWCQANTGRHHPPFSRQRVKLITPKMVSVAQIASKGSVGRHNLQTGQAMSKESMGPTRPRDATPLGKKERMMTTRDGDLHVFIDAARAAFCEYAQDTASHNSLTRIFAALERPVPATGQAPKRLPVCAHLANVAAPENFTDPTLRRLVAAFASIECRLTWRRRDVSHPSASANCLDGHANAMVVGPGGLEQREDVWVGVSLLAPHVRYPDHWHLPEETYLVMSDGEFSQGGGSWFRPGVGGSFYNKPNIVHAMRSLKVPLFAFWALTLAINM